MCIRDRGSPRREFFSIALGGAIIAVPTVVGLRVVLNPLFGDGSGGILARLTTLDSLTVGGPPQAFKVVADKSDAWTTYKDLPLGLVYVQRIAEQDVLVFSASCPHAGCAVEYRNEGVRGPHYFCPCHESSFSTDGSLAPDNTQAKRGLDTLEVIAKKLEEGAEESEGESIRLEKAEDYVRKIIDPRLPSQEELDDDYQMCHRS